MSKYDELTEQLKSEADVYQSEAAKDIRISLSRLQSDIDYYSYRVFLIQKKMADLQKEYRKLIGVENEKTTD